MSKRLAIAFSLCVILSLSSAVHAQTMVIGDAVTLSDLIGGGSIQSGDKLFSDFTYFETGDMPSAGGVNVIPIVEIVSGQQPFEENYGIRLQGGFNDLTGGDPSDAFVTFTVTPTLVGRLISDAHLAGNPNVANDGIGLAEVTETFLPTFPSAQLSIFDSGSLDQTDWVIFDEPVESLDVQKDILLNAGTSSGASISFIDQTFSQVPEPTTGLLTLWCLLGLAFAKRK